MNHPLLSYSGKEISGRLLASDLNFDFGEYWHILGPNGAGKTTLLLALSGLLPAKDLRYDGVGFNNKSLLEQAQQRAFLSQQHASEFDISVSQLLYFFTTCNALPSTLDAALEINDLLDRSLSTLSGGQQQRFHIARCILQVYKQLKKGKGILILDEPLQGLDIKHQHKVLALLNGFCEQGNLVVMTCHDVNMSAKYASHIALLKASSVVFSGKIEEGFTSTQLSHIFDVNFSLNADNHSSNCQYFDIQPKEKN